MLRARIATVVLVSTLVLGTVYGMAASLNVSSTQLGVGTATVTSCDSNGTTASYTWDGDNFVTAIEVSGVAEACTGQRITVNLLGGGGDTGSATVVTGGTTSVPMAAKNLLVSSVTSIRVTIRETSAP